MTEAWSSHNDPASAVALQSFQMPQAELYLWRRFLSESESLAMQQWLTTLQWQQPAIRLYGKSVAIPRRQIWMGDPHCSYRYSGVTFVPQAWEPSLDLLRQRICQHTGYPFNAVLLNWYQHGEHHMGWHSDDEAELGPNPVIASLSLGQTRRFDLLYKQDETQLSLQLSDGDLLLMAGPCQHYWQHRVPKQTKVQCERLNLTFRYLPVR